jgi:hypothetical protein
VPQGLELVSTILDYCSDCWCCLDWSYRRADLLVNWAVVEMINHLNSWVSRNLLRTVLDGSHAQISKPSGVQRCLGFSFHYLVLFADCSNAVIARVDCCFNAEHSPFCPMHDWEHFHLKLLQLYSWRRDLLRFDDFLEYFLPLILVLNLGTIFRTWRGCFRSEYFLHENFSNLSFNFSP